MSDHSPVPLFAAPHYHGSRDPECVWNPTLKRWFFYYTGSRVLRDPGHDLLAGTPVGVASSSDWREWIFEGYCAFDGKDNQPDAELTYWAPALVADGDLLHMFVLIHTGKNTEFRGGEPNGIHHFTAPQARPLEWTHRGRAFGDITEGMDAAILRVGAEWHMYYRSYVENGRDCHLATSPDLFTWTRRGEVPGDVRDIELHGMKYQEGAYAFRWKDAYWLLTDPFGHGLGLALYRSDDTKNWKYLGRVLAEKGTHPTDTSHARHPSVAVIDDRAFVFYHVEPYRDYSIKPLENAPPLSRRTYVQLAELLWDGERVSALRSGNFALPARERIARGPG